LAYLLPLSMTPVNPNESSFRHFDVDQCAACGPVGPLPES